MSALRILLVDDDIVIATLLEEMLGDLGHFVCGIETTEAGAVHAALTSLPDLMIVDARLGDGSGIAAIEAILRTITARYIIMSGDWFTVDNAEIVLLQKPFMQRDLIHAIDRAVLV